MGAVPTVSATTLKPDEATTDNIPVSEMMTQVKRRSRKKVGTDMSGCIHVMHPNRMADMPGCTVLSIENDKVTPIVRNGMM